jgi:AraC family chitin signaling transcriptional activator
VSDNRQEFSFIILAILFLICLFFQPTYAQSLPVKGVPKIATFTPGDYGHIGKVWSIDTDDNNRIFFASDKGLVRFDGLEWRVFKGSTGFTRSLDVVNDSTIVTGSDLDFGIWHKDAYGEFSYSSLYPFKEELSNINEEFWYAYKHRDSYVFASFQNLYIVKNQQVTKVSAPRNFVTSFKIDDELYFVDKDEGLYKLADFSLLKVAPIPGNIAIQTIGGFKSDGGLTLVTQKMGCWSFKNNQWSPSNTSLTSKLVNSQVFSFKDLGNELLAFGTILSGVYITDTTGKILHHIHKLKGLVNNTVLALDFSRHGTLWLGLDYGISKVSLTSGFTYVHDYFGAFGTASSALLRDDLLYLGTNQGLYTIPWNDLDNGLDEFNFKLIPKSEGQVWSIEKIGEDIIVGHDKGLFKSTSSGLQQMDCPYGVWTTILHKDHLFVGTYNGIFIYKNNSISWELDSKMDSIAGSCSQLVFETDNVLWINIPNFGVVRTELDGSFQPTRRELFDSSKLIGDNIRLVKDGGILIYTSHHIYTFDDASNSFHIIKNNSSKTLRFPMLPGNYLGSKLDNKHLFYPIYNGFAIESLSQEDQSVLPPGIVFKSILAFSKLGSRLFIPNSLIPYAYNTIKITAFIPNTEDIAYRFSSDMRKSWSEWDENVDFDLLHLAAGKYQIFIQAKVGEDQILEDVIHFSIDKPFWYQWYMYPLYLFIVFVFIYIIRLSRHRSLERQRLILEAEEQSRLEQIKEQHRQELIQLEQERLISINEDLKNQLKEKTIELATKAKSNEDKTKMIHSLKEVLDSVEKEPTKLKIKWKEIQLLLDNFQGDDDRVFEMQMNELHQEFFQMIKADFPHLSPSDLRMCAYIRIGLSTKEIADLFQVQPSSAYISRSRLRKKLRLEAEEDLYSFLNRYQSGGDL